MNILHISSSARVDGSDSRKLANDLIEHLKSQGDCNLVERDANHGLHLLTADHLGAYYTPKDKRSDAQQELVKISDEIVAELHACDILILSFPMYNYNVPAAMKMWQDLAMREGETFKTTKDGVKGLLSDKRAFAVITNGGMPVENPDNLLQHITSLFFKGLGIQDQTYIEGANLAYDKENSLKAAAEMIKAVKI